jgi:hypothetical protein
MFFKPIIQPWQEYVACASPRMCACYRAPAAYKQTLMVTMVVDRRVDFLE